MVDYSNRIIVIYELVIIAEAGIRRWSITPRGQTDRELFSWNWKHGVAETTDGRRSIRLS